MASGFWNASAATLSHPFRSAGGETPEFALTDTGTSAVGNPSFTGKSFGAEDAGRDIIVAISASASNATTQSITAVTIGGVSATRIFRIIEGNTARDVEFWAARVPTGTTGTIAITSAFNRWIIAVYRAVGLNSLTATDSGTASNNGTVAIDVQAGGVILAGATALTVSAFDLTNVTPDNAASAGTTHQGALGSEVFVVGQSVTVDYSGTPSTASMAVIALR